MNQRLKIAIPCEEEFVPECLENCIPYGVSDKDIEKRNKRGRKILCQNWNATATSLLLSNTKNKTVCTLICR